MSRSLSRDQVLAWRENWSYTDREQIAHALDALGESDFYEPNTRTYVGARVGGRVALSIAPGYLHWRSPTFIENLDRKVFPNEFGGPATDTHRWYALSTFRARGEPTPSFHELRASCPQCFMEPASNGRCGCD